MKKLVLIILSITFLLTNSVFAEEELQENIDTNTNINQFIYNPYSETWSLGNATEDSDIQLTKQLVEAGVNYTQFFYNDGSLAATLNTDYEFIRNGKLYGVNNNELKFYEIIYNGEYFEEIPIGADEIQNLFPDTELIRLSQIDSDHKMWLSKPIFKKKDFLFINDSNKSYYKLTPRVKKLQQSEIKGLITIPYYGMFTLDHYGEYKGKIRIYIRGQKWF